MGAFGGHVGRARGLAYGNTIVNIAIIGVVVLDVGVSRFGHFEGGHQQRLEGWEEEVKSGETSRRSSSSRRVRRWVWREGSIDNGDEKRRGGVVVVVVVVFVKGAVSLVSLMSLNGRQ